VARKNGLTAAVSKEKTGQEELHTKKRANRRLSASHQKDRGERANRAKRYAVLKACPRKTKGADLRKELLEVQKKWREQN